MYVNNVCVTGFYTSMSAAFEDGQVLDLFESHGKQRQAALQRGEQAKLTLQPSLLKITMYMQNIWPACCSIAGLDLGGWTCLTAPLLLPCWCLLSAALLCMAG